MILALALPVAHYAAAPFSWTVRDLRGLRAAVRDEMAGKRDYIQLTFDQAQSLPAYDNAVHYAGVTNDRAIAIMATYGYKQPRGKSVMAFERSNTPMVTAFVLGTMDIGAAGPKWKKYYDSLARADGALSASVKDRYKNRHAAATRLAAAILALKD